MRLKPKMTLAVGIIGLLTTILTYYVAIYSILSMLL